MSTDSKYKFSRSGILMIPFSFLYRNSLIWIVLLTAWAGGELHSTHIVGGDMSYRCLGNNQYEITLTLRRDCFNGGEDAPFDDPASIGFFDQYGTPLIHFGNHGQVFIPFTGDDTIQAEIPGVCSILSSPVCVHEATYRTVVYLPPMEGDYILAYQRCCRNGTLNNIINPLETGATYFVRIREEAQPVCNSGPSFNQWPDIYICANNELVFDHSATDEDGDSLVYKLCTPSKGANTEEPRPQPPVKPPFGTVEWVEGFDLENLLGGEPLTIDPVTGIITATPDLQGQYLIGICVEEYRDGELLSTTRRDFEYNVVLCLEEPSTDFTFSEGFCNGLTGTFTNLTTNADSYKWYFDFPNDDPAFTSTETSPSFTYPDTGIYTVRLEATNSESGETCTSIVEKTVYVTDQSLNADFDHTLLQCEGDSLLVRFNDLSEDAFETAEIISWQWEIISDSDTLFSMEQNPVFKVPGNQEFNIVLTIMSSTGCEDQKTEIRSVSSIFPTAISILLLDCLNSGFYVEFSDDTEYPDTITAEERIWNIVINGNVQMGGGSDLILQIPDSANITATLTTVLNNGCMGRAEDTFIVDRKTLVDFEIEFSACLAENLFRYHFTNTSHEFFHPDSTLFEWEILYDDETLRFEENEFDLELGLNQEIVVTLTAGYNANCQFSKSDTINTSDLIGGNPSFEYELLDCSEGSFSIEFSDNTSELFGGSELIARKWLIVAGSETFESMDSSFMLEFTPSGDLSISLTHEYANGCIVTSVKDQGLNIPNINFIPDPVIVCEGVPAFIVENPDTSFNYEWSPLEGLTFSGENDFSNPQALPDQSTLYRVTVSDGDCRITDSIYVYRAEDIELEILGNTEICNGNLQLSVSGAGVHDLYEWSLDEDFNTILATAQEIDVPVPETAEQIYVRIQVNSCPVVIASASIANNSVSLEFSDGPLYTCTGSGTYLVTNPNSAWDYQWSPVEGLTFDPDDDFSNPFALPDTTTTYRVTVTNGACSTEGMVIVNRFEDTELEVISSSEDCDEELTLNVSGAPEGSLYEWSWREDFSELLTTGAAVSITLTGEYDYIYVRAVLGECVSDPLQISVKDQFVSLEFFDDPLITCSGSGTMIIANPNPSWTYEWSPMDGLTFDPDDDFSNPVALPDTTTTYSVTVTSGACSTEGMVTLYRFDTIELEVGSTSEDCDNDITLTASGAPAGSVYEWSISEEFADLLSTGPILSITLTGEFDRIYVRATYGQCATNPVEIAVQDQFVSLDFLEGPLFACSGSGTMLVAYPNSAWTYEWSPLEGLTFDSEADRSNPVALPDTTTTYSVTVTNGPCSEEGIVTVYRAEDIELTVQNTGDVCDSIMTLMATGAPEGTDYEWSMTADFEDIFATGNQVEFTLMESEVRIYVRALLGPCPPAVSFIDVTDQSVAVDFFGQPLVSCSGSGTYLVSNPNSQWRYEWFPVEGLVFESEDDQSNPFAQPGETTTYYVTVTNGVCDETDSVRVVLSQDINLQLRGDISICDENILLTVSGAEGAEYIWSTSAIFADTLAIGDTLMTTQTEGEVSYFVKGVFDNFCGTRVEHITVTNQAVSVLLPAGPVIVCEGEGSKLVLNPNSNWTYTWDPVEGLIFDDPADLSDPTALPDQTTLYSVTVTNGFCSDTASVEVARSEELTLQITGDTMTCGESTVLSVVNLELPVIYEWSRDEGFSQIIHQGAIFIVAAQQARDTLYVRAMSGECQIASSFIVLLNLTPPIELLGDFVVTCEAEPVSLVTNPDSNYTYIWMPEDGLILESEADKSNPLALPDTTTEYVVTVINGDCQAMDTITVSRIDDLTVVANQDSVDCDGNAYLSASTEAANVEYQWSADSAFTEILAVGSHVNISVNGADSVFVRAAAGACISPYTILPIDFEPVLLEFFSDPLIVCRDIPSRIIANPNAGWTYDWNPVEGLDFPDGNHDPVVTLSESMTYFVTVSDGRCDLMDSIEVIATDTIPISLAGDTSSCDGFTNLMAETMGTLPVIWSVNRNFDPVLVTSDTLNTAIEGKKQTFYARALMEGTTCESEVDSITVTNNAISLNEVSDLQICDNDTLAIAISSADTLQMIEVTWTEDPHIISVLDQPLIEVVQIAEEDTFVLHFMAGNQFLCELEDSLIVRTGTRQNSPAVNYEQVCGEYQVCFTTDAEPGTFLWNFGDEGTESDSSSFADICYTYPGTGEYEVTISSTQAACGFEAVTTTVEVEEILTIDVTTADTVYCQGDTVNISAETNGDPDNILWSSTTSDSIGSGSELNYVPSGMDTVYAIITNNSGCGDTAFVVLRQYLFDLVVEPYDPVCPGETMTITVTNNTSDNLTYAWSPEDCILTGSGTAMPEIWATESKDLVLTVTNPDNQCTEEIVVPVEVRDFNVDLEVSPDTMINLSESVEITVVTDADGELTYQWSTGDTGEFITITPEETSTYTVIVTDEFGCSGSDQVTVEVRQPLCNEFDVFLPTAFSPNADGINDVLYVRSNFVREMLFVIYDRWGNEVFRTTDINTGWNGRFRNNGHEMAPNAYAFSLQVVCINDLEYSTAGNVSLIR